ncbi:hypothetical protein FOZ63_001863, partial [Perkinsus olseni]
MTNFIPIRLLTALPMVVNATLNVGWFFYKGKDYDAFFVVNENQTAENFAFNAHTRRGPGIIQRTSSSHNLAFPDLEGALPVTKVKCTVYSIGFPLDVLHNWYTRIAESLYTAGHVDSINGFPPAGIQPGDLVTITQTSGDTYTTNFRDETIEFRRRSMDLQYLKPGLFEYDEPVAPHLKLSVYVRYDETRRDVARGSVGVLVACDGRPTSRFHFRLVQDDNDKPYQRYNVESAGRGTFDQFRQM